MLTCYRAVDVHAKDKHRTIDRCSRTGVLIEDIKMDWVNIRNGRKTAGNENQQIKYVEQWPLINVRCAHHISNSEIWKRVSHSTRQSTTGWYINAHLKTDKSWSCTRCKRWLILTWWPCRLNKWRQIECRLAKMDRIVLYYLVFATSVVQRPSRVIVAGNIEVGRSCVEPSLPENIVMEAVVAHVA